MQPFLESDMVWRLVIAAVLGVVLGFERSLAGKHAGMRTYALVSMGSALFTIAGLLASLELNMFVGVNPLQIASSVVIGIGFIGSGLAVFRGEHPVELTTATGIWLAAGVGIAVGFGFFGIAIAASILGVIIFSLLAKVERAMRVRYGSKYQETNG